MRNPTRLHHEHGAVCTMYKLLDQRSGAKPVRRVLGAEWATHGGDGLPDDVTIFVTKPTEFWVIRDAVR